MINRSRFQDVDIVVRLLSLAGAVLTAQETLGDLRRSGDG